MSIPMYIEHSRIGSIKKFTLFNFRLMGNYVEL